MPEFKALCHRRDRDVSELSHWFYGLFPVMVYALVRAGA
jgi:hypothetical protein